MKSLTTKYYNIFLWRIYFTSNDGRKNTFFHQTKNDTIELKKYKLTNNSLSWRSKGVYNSKLKPLYTDFLHSIKLSEYRMGIKFDEHPLAVEKSNYTTEVVNAYIANDLDT